MGISVSAPQNVESFLYWLWLVTYATTQLYSQNYLWYRSNATSHLRVPNSRVENCYMWVNCNKMYKKIQI